MIKIKIVTLIILGLLNFSTSFALELELKELVQELAKDKKERVKEIKKYRRELAQAKKEIEIEFKKEFEDTD
ncbi:MAG: hypothetical protein HAW60_05095 [Bdellovibrionales bacterium]|nr:hypothetical protein [Bdellovibrionales bacterium]